MVEVVENLLKGGQKTRDEIGREDSVNPFLKRTDRQDIIIDTGPEAIVSRGINDSFILGHPVNGVLGISKLGDRRSTATFVGVKNKTNVYKEFFRTNMFRDTVTTATWSSELNYNINTTLFTTAAGSNSITFIAGQTAISRTVALNNEIYSSATMILEGTNLSNLSLFMSSDGGSNFESVSNNIEHIFINKTIAGIKWKVIATGSATVTKIIINYSI